MSFDIKGTGTFIQTGIENSSTKGPTGNIPADWTRVSATGIRTTANNIVFYFATATVALDAYIKLPKLEQGNMPTAWTPAPEDIDSATAKAQLTADNASLALSNYKSDADGRISKAQADIIVNANAITQKVSQSDYNAKTGDLTTKVNTAQSTADSASSTIGAYKTTNDGRVASAESKITQNTDNINLRVTKTDYDANNNTINGKFSAITVTTDAITSSVSDVKAQVDGLTVGGRNLLLKSKALFGVANNGSSVTTAVFDSTTNMWHITSPAGYDIRGIYFNIANNTSSLIPAGQPWSFSIDIKGTGVFRRVGPDNDPSYIGPTGNVSTDWTRVTATGVRGTASNFVIYFNTTTTPLDVYVKLPKYEQGNLPSGWSPAPEDVDSSISSVKQTADDASTAITNYKTSNDGRVRIAEGNIKTNADAITQKVSIVDYNANNGTVSTRIGNVETANDKITQSVSSLTTQVNNLKQVNLVNNSQMTPDYAGWHFDTPWDTRPVTTDHFGVNGVADATGAMYVWHDQAVSNSWLVSDPIQVNPGQVVSMSVSAAMPSVPSSGVPLALYIKFYDANKGQVGSLGYNVPLNQLSNTFTTFKYEKQVAPANSKYAAFVLGWNVGGRISIGKPMFVIGDTVGDYVPGQYNNNTKIATQQITIDSISDVVSNPTTGLSKRVQTAEGTLSQVQGTDIPNLQKATYWQPYNSLDLNTYRTQGSYYFNSTTVKPNGPTTSTDWMYLQVEVANADKVTQIAWYDKTTSAKITYKRQYISGNWSPWYANDNDSVTSISQTNGAIQQEVKDRTNGDSNTLTQAKNFTTSAITSSENGMRSQITQTSDAIIAQVGANNLVSNSEFDPLNKGWYPIGTTVGSVLGSAVAPGSYTTAFSDWQTADGSQLLDYNSSTWYSTDLVQAQAQVVYSASIVAGRTALTNSVALDLRIAFFDGAKKLLGYASAGNIITGSDYSSFKLYKFENQMAPANTRYVSLVIAHLGTPTGGSDIIGRPTLNYGAKVTTYSPTKSSTASSVQLSLMKDNWSIGINDNTGKLASGVFGTIDGMNLVGNKMTINANQTTITGTTWIQTGMIGQGIIGSAQISQLDVNKLVGNTSNFVKSAWDSAYGSTVTIDGSGMAIRADGNNGFYTRLQSGKLQFESLYSDATLPGGVRHEVIGSVFGGSDAQVGGDVDALSFTLFDQTFPSFTDGYPVGSPKDGSGYIWGGDKITWNVADTQAGHVRELFGWYNATASNVQGISRGFNFFDRVNFNGSEIEISGAQNNLIFTWAQWNGYFSNEKSPAIVAANKGWRGGGIAFGNNSVVVYNAANGINKILM